MTDNTINIMFPCVFLALIAVIAYGIKTDSDTRIEVAKEINRGYLDQQLSRECAK